jgi:hypothetical protein
MAKAWREIEMSRFAFGFTSALPWRGLAIVLVVLLLAPSLAATDAERPGTLRSDKTWSDKAWSQESWLSLLMGGPAQTDPTVVALQHRAKDSLDRLLRSRLAGQDKRQDNG